jgi:hypothetical protein
MRNQTQRILFALVCRVMMLAAVLIASSFSCFAAEGTSAIVCRDAMSIAARTEVARRLRTISGLPDLAFDDQGYLRIPPGEPSTGSITARGLLRQALSRSTLVVLEDASNRVDVVFAKVVRASWVNKATGNQNVFLVLIDFSDFDRIIGDRTARESFNVGWAVLHEIDHVVNDSVDATEMGIAGPCEDHLNQMRQECHLPLRTEYFFTLFPRVQNDFKTRLVRLAFDASDPVSHKHHRYWLMWDAALVGGLPKDGQVASL